MLMKTSKTAKCYVCVFCLLLILKMYLVDSDLPLNIVLLSVCLLFLRFYLFIFREGKGRRKKHQCVVASRVPPSGDPTCTPGCALGWESNQQPFGSQASTQSTEPH